MLRLIKRRLLGAVILIAMASVFSFLLISAFHGNPALLIAEQRVEFVSKEMVQQVEKEYGLDQPITVRYAKWVAGALRGDLGKSLRTNENVATALAQRTLPTAVLVVGGGISALLIGVTLSFLGALWPGSIVDKLTRGIALIGASSPNFFIAAMVVYVFGVISGFFRPTDLADLCPGSCRASRSASFPGL